MSGFEENEISKNANGGTEIAKRTLAKYIPEDLLKEFQIIPSRFRDIEEDKIRIYWCHDLPEDPELNHLKNENSRDRFHKIIFNCNWHLNDFHTKLNVPLNEKVDIIEMPFEPLELVQKDKNKINLIYFSTPQRGLELLYPVVDSLSKKYDNIHLDVFSSFKIYGWEDADKNFEPLYDKIRNHSHMTYHGFAPQDVLRKHIEHAHILAYPNIWKETACRVLIESMSAGLMCVHPNLAALADTSGMLTTMYQYNEDINKHAAIFYKYLEHAVTVVNTDPAQNYLKFVKAYTDNRFNVNKIASQWESTLRELLDQYPTVESRKLPEQMFVYKV
jgi:UDP-glucose:(glucosyl)LPS alpha-1,2-glucosyltransferase